MTLRKLTHEMKDDTVEKRLCLVLRTCTVRVLLEIWQVEVIRVISIVISCTTYRNASSKVSQTSRQCPKHRALACTHPHKYERDENSGEYSCMEPL